MKRTKGEIEAEISKAITQWERFPWQRFLVS